MARPCAGRQRGCTPGVRTPGWHPRRGAPLPAPAGSAPREARPGRFGKARAMIFVLFAANHRLPSRRGGLPEPPDGSAFKAGLLQTAPFARRAAPSASRARRHRTRGSLFPALFAPPPPSRAEIQPNRANPGGYLLTTETCRLFLGPVSFVQGHNHFLPSRKEMSHHRCLHACLLPPQPAPSPAPPKPTAHPDGGG